MMTWVALRAGGQVVDEFDAPADRELARAVAWSKFGPGVEQVLSFSDYHEWLREEDALARNQRLRAEHNDAA